MIYRLRKKFIKICILSFVGVLGTVLLGIYIFTTINTNSTLDRHADFIMENDGRFPTFESNRPGGEKPHLPDGFNKESPFTTRYFTVKYYPNDRVFTDIRAVFGVTSEDAEKLAGDVMESGSLSGWKDGYRYKIYHEDDVTTAIFVNGEIIKSTALSFMMNSLGVFGVCGLIIILLIILISKRAVKPAAQNYEKQKQFITDANHELKTPLTLISANLDILENEYGQNEWLSDIREETSQMARLVNSLVSLARTDEENNRLVKCEFSLSDGVADTVSMFEAPISASGKLLKTQINPNVTYNGNEESIRRLTSVLMDNAVKYCDPNGTVTVTLTGGKHPILSVENSFENIKNVELSKLFDRFYRGDRARTYGNGFGIGLSVAKSIVEKHGGSITAQMGGDSTIIFKVKL